MRFDYSRHLPREGAPVRRPVIPITLRNPQRPDAPAIGYHGLVDSGSDRCIFSGDIAELLGIDITATGKVVHIGGVVAGERRPIYLHPIEIEVGEPGGPAYTTVVGFMPDFAKPGFGLLGRAGFFEEFAFVKFRDHLHELEIGKRRNRRPL